MGMMSAGRDVSNFFASVVMNIAQDSFEVKVLVYLYLVRTAEQKADEALLSINSFQKDLAHQNPRVRALALRVMSSIRVQVIVPVVILAVRKCAVDPSPYVRKAAAHAIPKVFRLDPKRKDELTEIIETMLRDSTPFVLSSAVAAFQEVCPDRIDLIHRHYRKMCRMLVDCDEWGQILLANLLSAVRADAVHEAGCVRQGAHRRRRRRRRKDARAATPRRRRRFRKGELQPARGHERFLLILRQRQRR